MREFSDVYQILEQNSATGAKTYRSGLSGHWDRNGFHKLWNGSSVDSGEPTGWKFHLSVAPHTLPRATEILCATAQKMGFADFKVADSDIAKKHAADSQQAGKMAVLYDRGEKNWPQILAEIENRFAEAGIQPGPTVAGDRALTGSRYIYYRNDGHGTDAGYVPAAAVARLPAEQRYNPLGAADPFRTVDLTATTTTPVQTAQSSSPLPTLGEELFAIDLKRVLGEENIRGVRSRPTLDGTTEYLVEVPSGFSRQKLAPAGIADPEKLQRTGTSGVTDCDVIVVPEASLPSQTRKDMAFLGKLNILGVPVSAASRSWDNAGDVTYLLPKGQDVTALSRLAGFKADVLTPESALPSSAVVTGYDVGVIASQHWKNTKRPGHQAVAVIGGREQQIRLADALKASGIEWKTESNNGILYFEVRDTPAFQNAHMLGKNFHARAQQATTGTVPHHTRKFKGPGDN